mmetsp:Transcript_7977/g.20481  ORF Transcript_7977/g.20481 Transcript_7977/m.20481 type:complete len:199 (+) Transcript_7977:418-1014(+)
MPALTLATMARPCVPAQMATTPCRRASAWHSNARLAAAAPRRQRAARGLRPRMAQEDGAATATEGKQRLSYQHLMVTLFDSNPYLAEGSRQALKTAAGLAAWNASKITVVVVDDEGQAVDEQTAVKLTAIKELLVERGCTDFDVMEKITTENHSALVGDVADDIKADLVLLSTDCVHEESVNANLLAEFCPCATLLIP